MPGGGHIGSWIRLMKENTYDDHAQIFPESFDSYCMGLISDEKH